MNDAGKSLFGVTSDPNTSTLTAGSCWRFVKRSRPGDSLQELDLKRVVGDASGQDIAQMEFEPPRDPSWDPIKLCTTGDHLVFIYTDSPAPISDEEALGLLGRDPTCTPDGLLDLLRVAGSIHPIDLTVGTFSSWENPRAAAPLAVKNPSPGSLATDLSDLDKPPFDHRFVSASLPTADQLNGNGSSGETWLTLHGEAARIAHTYMEPEDPDNLLSQPRGFRSGNLFFKDKAGDAQRPVKFLLIPWDAAWSTYRLIHLAMSALVRMAAPMTPSLAREPMTAGGLQALVGDTPSTCGFWTEDGKPLLDRQVNMMLERQDHECSDRDGPAYLSLVAQLPQDVDAPCPGVIQSLFISRGYVPPNSVRTLALFTGTTINAALGRQEGARFAYPSNTFAPKSAASTLAQQMVRLYADLDDFPLRVCKDEKCRRLFVRQSGARSRKATKTSKSRQVTPTNRHSRGVLYCSTRCGGRARQARFRER